MGKSLAESTKAAYRTHLRTFLRFCFYYGVTPVPASQTTIMCYIAFLARTLNPKSINCYINIIRILHLDAGYSNPLFQNFAVTNLKRGIARELGKPPKQMHPISCEILVKIHGCLSMRSGRDISFWAACAVAFFGFLRKSTLVPKRKVNPGDDCLLRKDLHMPSRDQFVLYIRKTKTIQFGQRILCVPYVSAPSRSLLCPVTAVISLLRSIPYMPEIPLFAFYEGKKLSWWTHDSFVARLRELLKKVGLPANEFSCHSFRRGGASFGFQLNLSLVEIKQRGDWASNAVESYIHIGRAHLNTVASKLVHGAVKPR